MNLKEKWDYIQSLLDVDGDCWMGLYTLTIIVRLALAAFGHASISGAEAAAYGSAIGAFAYSNKGGPKS